MVQPSFRDGFARSPGESVAPELWPVYAWIPSLGCQGKVLFDVAGGKHGTTNQSWGPYYAINTTGLGASVSAPIVSNEISILSYANTQTAGFSRIVMAGSTQVFVVSNSDTILTFGVGGGSDAFTVGSILGKKTIIATYKPALKDVYVNGVKPNTVTNRTDSINYTITYLYNQAALDRPYFGNIYATMIWKKWLYPSQVRQLSADPLLPFRRRKPVFYSMPAASGFKPFWACNATVLIGGPN